MTILVAQQKIITPADRIQSATMLLFFAAVIWIVGRLLLARIGQNSPARKLHGKFVLGWMLVGWVVGGTVGVWLLDFKRYYPNEADVGFAGFGLLIGWVIGMIHGLIVPAARRGGSKNDELQL